MRERGAFDGEPRPACHVPGLDKLDSDSVIEALREELPAVTFVLRETNFFQRDLWFRRGDELVHLVLRFDRWGEVERRVVTESATTELWFDVVGAMTRWTGRKR